MSTQLQKNSFKSMSCLGRIHQFPRNFLRWQAPGCIQLYSFRSMVFTIKMISLTKELINILKILFLGVPKLSFNLSRFATHTIKFFTIKTIQLTKSEPMYSKFSFWTQSSDCKILHYLHEWAVQRDPHLLDRKHLTKRQFADRQSANITKRLLKAIWQS